jgi:hypothetical protein
MPNHHINTQQITGFNHISTACLRLNTAKQGVLGKSKLYWIHLEKVQAVCKIH